MIVDDAMSDGEKISEVLTHLRIVSMGPSKRRQSNGELDYVYDVPQRVPRGAGNGGVLPNRWLPWAELLRRTVGVDPEICICSARITVLN